MMEESENYRVYIYVRDVLKKNPELLPLILKGTTDGISLAVNQARRDQADWEMIANMAMNKRLMDGNELFLADKIDSLKSRSAMNWEWYVDKLRGIVAKKLKE